MRPQLPTVTGSRRSMQVLQAADAAGPTEPPTPDGKRGLYANLASEWP